MIENKSNNVAATNSANKVNSSHPNNSLALYYGIGAVVVILLIIFVSTGRENFADVTNDQVLDIPTEDVSNGSVNAPVKKVPSISYADALVKYKDARIQLDDDCQAFPNSVTYKNGTSIMIDNRSGVTRTVKVGGAYTIKAYSFKIIKLDRPTLPETLLIDCDNYQNVATILVQK
jgi:hypothetical protein